MELFLGFPTSCGTSLCRFGAFLVVAGLAPAAPVGARPSQTALGVRVTVVETCRVSTESRLSRCPSESRPRRIVTRETSGPEVDVPVGGPDVERITLIF